MVICGQQTKNSDMDLFTILYTKPWARVGPYMIGLALGYLLLKTKDYKLGLSRSKIRLINLAVWIIALGRLSKL